MHKVKDEALIKFGICVIWVQLKRPLRRNHQHVGQPGVNFLELSVVIIDSESSILNWIWVEVEVRH